MALKQLIPALLLPFSLCAQDTTMINVEVDAKCNVYSSMMKVAKVDVPGGAGIDPIAINVSGYRKITIRTVEGRVTNCYKGDSTEYCDADGYTSKKGFNATIIGPMKAFSGIMHNKKSMFLAGAFISDGVIPDETPETINFTSFENYTGWGPDLYQVFYIGNGKNSKGEVQTILIPTYADKLILGFIDGAGFVRSFDDNNGTIKASLLLEKR